MILNKNEGRILTPDQMKEDELKIKLKNLLESYGYMLIPVMTIIGKNMETSVQLAKVQHPAGAGAGSMVPK